MVNEVNMREKIFKPSKTEDYAIKLIPYNTRNILSIGISTGCSAEVRMAQRYYATRIIATTIDKEGRDYARRVVAKYGLTKQIQVKLEDVRNPMPYPDEAFDLVYARLVLHYLTKQEFEHALNEIYRVLKPGGLFYIVMHSIRDKNLKKMHPTYDAETNLVTFTNQTGARVKRQFFDIDELVEILTDYGFNIARTKICKEKLYVDFQRTKEWNHKSKLISVVAYKPKMDGDYVEE